MTRMAAALEKLTILESFNQQEVVPPVLEQLVLHVGHVRRAGNRKSISPMYLPRKIQRGILASLKNFHCKN